MPAPTITLWFQIDLVRHVVDHTNGTYANYTSVHTRPAGAEYDGPALLLTLDTRIYLASSNPRPAAGEGHQEPPRAPADGFDHPHARTEWRAAGMDDAPFVEQLPCASGTPLAIEVSRTCHRWLCITVPEGEPLTWTTAARRRPGR